MRKLILIELNEINFQAVEHYISHSSDLPNFERLLREFYRYQTTSEVEYSTLEPWIQWVSVHTGLSFEEHGVFRLGDMVENANDQIFEVVERQGATVGVLGAMNAANKLKRAAFFIPDPWTATDSDNSAPSRAITHALRQAVNDNSSGTLTMKSAFNIAWTAMWLISWSQLCKLGFLAIRSRGKPWRKALFLDHLLTCYFQGLNRKAKPDFSTIFLNAGAHIQHHYFANSSFYAEKRVPMPSWYIPASDDPVKEMVTAYDTMLGQIMSQNSNYDIVLATGLSQVLCEAPTFYYRLRDHEHFLSLLQIQFVGVLPRMTRDFLVEFKDSQKTQHAERLLSSVKLKKKNFFEIDNRGNSLFVTLCYDDEIMRGDALESECSKPIQIYDHTVFVALKNGVHASTGEVFSSFKCEQLDATKPSHVSNLFDALKGRFIVESPTQNI